MVDKPELRIIDDETFQQAQEVLHSRHSAFKITRERQSNKHLFSTLIKCKECGWSFRRTVRTYKNTYVRWLLGVPVIDLPDDSSLLLVDGQVEVVADGLVVAVDDVWDEHHLFDMVVVKDISRFARNTVDLLQNVRRLKAV